MKATKPLLLGILLAGIFHQLFGQGCSDAGFCTMGAMKPDQTFNKKAKLKLRSIEVSYYRGQTTLTPVVYVAGVDATLGIGENMALQVKLPYQWVNGNFDKTSGMGDISLSLTRKVIDGDNFDFSATIGTKIPSNKSDLKSSGKKKPLSEGLVLPMYYQTSLGSFDFVAGASLLSSKWLFATGIQAALTANNNTWWPGEWLPPVYPSESYVRSYDVATKLKRGTDIMFRAERNFRFTKYSFNVGALAIYRITKDQTEDRSTGEYVKLEGTTGLAFTLLASFTYNVNINSSIKLAYGKKLTDREVNPDGLTRHEVMTLGYLFRF